MTQGHAVVTGAFSNIGSAVAGILLQRGWTVATLTNRFPSPGDDPGIARTPLTFEPAVLRRAMAGVDVLINTYWVRFPYRGMTFDTAVDNSVALFAAARAAGVRRVVQVSVSNASLESPLGYYRGKARVEEALRTSGLAYAIVRPTLVVGPKDVLTNNIAWFLRRFPLIAVPTGQGYLMQPITLADTGRIIADAVEGGGNIETDAAGPDQLSFREYLTLLGAALHRRVRFVKVPPSFMLAALNLAGRLLRDIVLTREELEGLRLNLLTSRAPALGRESVLNWIRAHGVSFGTVYMNDTVQRFR